MHRGRFPGGSGAGTQLAPKRKMRWRRVWDKEVRRPGGFSSAITGTAATSDAAGSPAQVSGVAPGVRNGGLSPSPSGTGGVSENTASNLASSASTLRLTSIS
jgi:hypothetical protein